ncbi:hypothetical protein MMC10_002235 [Thelotrema lepadinum]|nr:hypothetical protein [Thelotrema lepadinum]
MILSPITTESQVSNEDDHITIANHHDESLNYTDQYTDQYADQYDDEDADESELMDVPPDIEPDGDYEFTWPECKELLHSLQTSKPSTASASLEPSFQANSSTSNNDWKAAADKAIASSVYWDNTRYHSANDGEMVTTAPLHASIVAAAKSSLTPAFLDRCMSLFFDRFNPTMPLLHRPTFLMTQHATSLITGAMAVGSLYMDEKGARQRGEILWHMAQQSTDNLSSALLTSRRPYDTWGGFELVMTNLLCRVYGALSSNTRIRSMTRDLTESSWSWPSKCGMLPLESFTPVPIPSSSTPDEQKNFLWRTWLGQETHFRVILGHYVLDGLSGHPSDRSASPDSFLYKLLDLVSSDTALSASTPDEWISILSTPSHQSSSFTNLHTILFPPTGIPSPLPPNLSFFPLRLLLEAIQSLVDDYQEADFGPVGGAIPKSDLTSSLFQIYDAITSTTTISPHQRIDLMMKWHTINLDLQISSYALRSALAHYHGTFLRPTLLEISDRPRTFNLPDWHLTTGARASLLHALSILALFQELHLPDSTSLSLPIVPIHAPFALLAAAAVLASFTTTTRPAISTIDVPETVDWQDVLFTEVDPSIILGEMAKPSTGAGTREFIHAGVLSGGGVRRDLGVDLEAVREGLRGLSGNWGIAGEGERMVGGWVDGGVGGSGNGNGRMGGGYRMG